MILTSQFQAAFLKYLVITLSMNQSRNLHIRNAHSARTNRPHLSCPVAGCSRKFTRNFALTQHRQQKHGAQVHFPFPQLKNVHSDDSSILDQNLGDNSSQNDDDDNNAYRGGSLESDRMDVDENVPLFFPSPPPSHSGSEWSNNKDNGKGKQEPITQEYHPIINGLHF